MASVIDICNLGLANIGDSATVSAIDPPDGSIQAEHCARFYPMARDSFIASHNWGFATRRASLSVLALSTLPAEWAYAYAYPTCLRLVAVLPADVVVSSISSAIFDEQEFLIRGKNYPFVVESLSTGAKVIYSNVEDATGVYLVSVTDTTKFSQPFVTALARLLSSYLAGPIIKGSEGMKVARAQLEWFEKVDAPRAKAADSQEGKNTSYDDFLPSSLVARR